MSVSQQKADSYYGPMAAATPTDGSFGNNVIRFATSTANISQALNTDVMQDGVTRTPYQGKYVNVQNEDTVSGLDFAFSNGAVTLTYGAVSASFAAGNAVAGWRLGPGQSISVICPPTATHVNFIQASGAAAAATIAFYLSEGPAVIR